jgi:glutamine amidotransferase
MGNGKIVIVNYGMGNLGSVERALRKVGGEVIVSSNPSLVEVAGGLVLPGVGSFRDCMLNLKKYRLIQPIKRFILSGRPFLGICLGMQVLFTQSEEFGHTPGLDILKGKVVHFPKGSGLKIPHMGWNLSPVSGRIIYLPASFILKSPRI